MSFTTIEVVRRHLANRPVGIFHVDGEPVRLVSTTSQVLKFRPLIEASEVVKGLAGSYPVSFEGCFGVDDRLILGRPKLVKGSVVVASDSSLSAIYRENIDYVVDHDAGLICRLPKGTLPPGADVIVWFLPYRLYVRGEDYRVDYQRGLISRTSDGNIVSGEWLEIDYDYDAGGVDDEVVANAIAEAGDQLRSFFGFEEASEIATGGAANRALVVAETYLAVAIVCRAKALQSASWADNDSLAKLWGTLAESYRRDALALMERVIMIDKTLSPPAKA